jgi:catalase (peroxidase I)
LVDSGRGLIAVGKHSDDGGHAVNVPAAPACRNRARRYVDERTRAVCGPSNPGFRNGGEG